MICLVVFHVALKQYFYLSKKEDLVQCKWQNDVIVPFSDKKLNKSVVKLF